MSDGTTPPAVLVVDDSLVVRSTVGAQLEAQGYAVVMAADGPQALACAEAAVPDVVLLDIMMPGLDGLEVLTRMKARDELAEVPVILMTGRTSTADLVRGLRLGAHDYLRKPCEPAELVARVAAALRVKSVHDRLRLRAVELDELARVDVLTGLHNRRHMDEQLGRLAVNGQGSGRRIVLLLIDIDQFKALNDSLGHDAGDQVLRVVADRLRAMLRAGDLAARWGGEEFIVLLPDTNLPAGAAVAERIRHAISDRPIGFEQSTVSLSVSIGVAEGPAPRAQDITRDADAALYRAKAAGRNRVEVAAARGAAPA